MKKNATNATFGTCLITALKIWGSAWAGMLVTILPMYIHRGLNKTHDASMQMIENAIIATVGLLASSVILMFLVSRSDETEKWKPSECWKVAGISVGIYSFAWLLWWIFSGNPSVISPCGIYISFLIGQAKEELPTFSGTILGILIYGAFYVAAIVLGRMLARLRLTKRREKM